MITTLASLELKEET